MDDIKKNYDDYVKSVTPTTSLAKNMWHAFLIGGAICLFGQILITLFETIGTDEETAGAYEIILLVFLAVMLTGLGIYPKLAKYAGAGTLVPITGFANSVSSPAIEFQKEGQIFGVGCRIFSIAGPVILFGILSSWVLGLLYWIGSVI